MRRASRIIIRFSSIRSPCREGGLKLNSWVRLYMYSQPCSQAPCMCGGQPWELGCVLNRFIHLQKNLLHVHSIYCMTTGV